MAIEDIIRALEEEADGEVTEIVDAAKMQASGILEDARAEADKIRADRLEHGTSAGTARGQQLVNAARLDNKRSLAAAKERGIADVYATAEKRLAETRKDSAYTALFTALAEEAVAGVEGAYTVQVDAADEALAKSVFGTAGATASIETMPTLGGLTIVADQGHVFRRNTLDERLAKSRKAGQSHVAEILFG